MPQAHENGVNIHDDDFRMNIAILFLGWIAGLITTGITFGLFAAFARERRNRPIVQCP